MTHATLQWRQDVRRGWVAAAVTVLVALVIGWTATIHMPRPAPMVLFWAVWGLISLLFGAFARFIAVSFPPRLEEQDEY